MNKNEPEIYNENNYIDQICLGSITFSESVNETEIVSKNKSRFKPKHIGECKICVYGPNEGQIPHFHIFNNDHSFECCVRIYENNFFSHGNKYRDTLNASQCRELNDWLKLENSNLRLDNISNWRGIMLMWEALNMTCKYPESKKTEVQPHYEDMYLFKDV